MRYLVFLFILFQSLSSTAQNGYSIEVLVNGNKTNKAYLGYYLGNKSFIKDTVIGENGRFLFKGDERLGEGLYMYIDPSDLSFSEFIVGKDQHFKISLTKGDELETLKAKGSEENALLFDYTRYLVNHNTKLAELREESEKMDPTTASFQRNQEAIKLIDNELLDYQNDLIETGKDLVISKLLLLNKELEFPSTLADPDLNRIERYHYYMKHYFDHIDFSASAMVRVPAFQSKIDDYFDRLVVQHPDSLKLAVDRLFNLASVNPEVFQFVTIESVNKFAKSDRVFSDGVYAHIVDQYYATGKANWVDEERMTLMKTQSEIIKRSEIFTISEEVEGNDPSNSLVSLHSQKGEMLLVFVFDPNDSQTGIKLREMNSILSSFNKEELQLVTVSSMGTEAEWKSKLSAWNLLNNPQIVNIRSEVDAYLFEKNTNLGRRAPLVLLLDQNRRIIAKDETMASILELTHQALGRTE